jgi:hypothetical protein
LCPLSGLFRRGGTGNAEIKAVSGTHALNARVIGTAGNVLDVIAETGGSLALTGGATNPATATLALSQSGSGSLAAGSVANAGTMTVSGTVAANAISGAGSTQVDASASLTADSIVQGTLSIAAGGVVTIRETTGGSVSTVPEPSTLTLLLAGAIGLLTLAWRRRK